MQFKIQEVLRFKKNEALYAKNRGITRCRGQAGEGETEGKAGDNEMWDMLTHIRKYSVTKSASHRLARSPQYDSRLWLYFKSQCVCQIIIIYHHITQ